MHGPAPATDASSPSKGADFALVLSLLLVLTGLASGIVWSQQAGSGGAEWRGIVRPRTAGAAALALRRRRAAGPELPRLRRFVTRVAAGGLVGCAALLVFFATRL